MIRAAALILLLILGGCSTSLRSSPDELIIGTEGAYPPWNFTRPDGSLAGFEADYLRVLCARIHRPCRMVAMDWDGMIAALQTGKIDLIADAMQITPERAAVLDFGRPYAQTTGVIATLRTSPLAHLPDRDAALDGADFVVIQLRVGGQAARLVDETLPLRYSCIGQETTGPGPRQRPSYQSED